MSLQSSNFEEALKENISLYTSPPGEDNESYNLFFQATREISLARYALTQQANSYFHAIQILSAAMEKITPEQAAVNPTLLTTLMMLIGQIEIKSKSLIETSTRVVGLLGTAINIDVDKAQLRSLLYNLPSLIKDSITQVSHDPELADKIALNLSNRIDQVMTSLRFSEMQIQSSGPQGVDENQYLEFLNSVPSSPSPVSH